MTTTIVNGKTYPVYQHLKEVKENEINGNLFGRWYNRNQFIKTMTEHGDPDGCAEYEGCIGEMDGENSHYCWYIELYDLNTLLNDDSIEDVDEFLDDEFNFHSSFLLEGSDGTIYLVRTDED
jgi:hypothetical protein